MKVNYDARASFEQLEKYFRIFRPESDVFEIKPQPEQSKKPKISKFDNLLISGFRSKNRQKITEEDKEESVLHRGSSS